MRNAPASAWSSLLQAPPVHAITTHVHTFINALKYNKNSSNRCTSMFAMPCHLLLCSIMKHSLYTAAYVRQAANCQECCRKIKTGRVSRTIPL